MRRAVQWPAGASQVRLPVVKLGVRSRMRSRLMTASAGAASRLGCWLFFGAEAGLALMYVVPGGASGGGGGGLGDGRGRGACEGGLLHGLEGGGDPLAGDVAVHPVPPGVGAGLVGRVGEALGEVGLGGGQRRNRGEDEEEKAGVGHGGSPA